MRRNWDDFDNYPDQLQRAMLDLEFNSGSVTPHTWPKLNKAIQAKDWNSIEKEMHLDTENKKRNIHREDLIKEIQINQQR